MNAGNPCNIIPAKGGSPLATKIKMKKLFVVSCLLLVVSIISSCAKEAKYSNLEGKIIWHGNKSLPYIALTFDDSPNPESTPKILDILKKYNTKATFFVLGKFAEKNPEVLKRIAKEGHEIGNHTYSHASGYLVDENKIKAELNKTSNIVKRATGKRTILFRPPFGFENWRFLKIAENLGYKIILWTFDVGDWNLSADRQNKVSAEEIENRILKNVEGGSIILLHDGGKDREELVKALPKIIERLRKRGFKFLKVSDLL